MPLLPTSDLLLRAGLLRSVRSELLSVSWTGRIWLWRFRLQFAARLCLSGAALRRTDLFRSERIRSTIRRRRPEP